MVCDIRPYKDNIHITRFTVGGGKINYTGGESSPAPSLIETKLLLNSVISEANRGGRFLILDLKGYFLRSDLPTAEYMKLHGKYFLTMYAKNMTLTK